MSTDLLELEKRYLSSEVQQIVHVKEYSSILFYYRARMSCCWGMGKLGDTGWRSLCHPARVTKDQPRVLLVCSEDALTRALAWEASLTKVPLRISIGDEPFVEECSLSEIQYDSLEFAEAMHDLFNCTDDEIVLRYHFGRESVKADIKRRDL